MRSFALVLGLSALSFAFAEDAPVVEDNPIGMQYIAILPDKSDSAIRGAVAVNSNANGTGANVQISISGLPDKGGPFTYHIHKCPVAGLNCTTAGSHLDPYGATDTPPCDPSQPDKCEVGDLSGKHGKMNGPSFAANYVDAYISTAEGTPAFVGNLSVVVHAADKTRLTCANFKLQSVNIVTTLSPAEPTADGITATFTIGTTPPEPTEPSSESSDRDSSETTLEPTEAPSETNDEPPEATPEPTEAPSETNDENPPEATTSTVTVEAMADKVFGAAAGVLGGAMGLAALLV
ncbi:hypothetical protein WHR41_05876 [Cladosporium halotolerans]|uniref:superoxide dismutase n=1 Tax=Cladosporium halotolerans TaxID=1052096 RepID=A0AB34KMG4_9PEZI